MAKSKFTPPKQVIKPVIKNAPKPLGYISDRSRTEKPLIKGNTPAKDPKPVKIRGKFE